MIRHLHEDACMDRLLYSKRQAAEVLSLSLRKLDSLIATHQILVKRIGRRVLIARQTLEQFAQKK